MTECSRPFLRALLCGVVSCVVCGFWFIGDLLIFNIRALRLVRSAQTREEVHDFFARNGKRPVEMVLAGGCFEYKGWAVPRRPVLNEAESYDLSFGVRVYVYYGFDGKVEYVFSSQS